MTTPYTAHMAREEFDADAKDWELERVIGLVRKATRQGRRSVVIDTSGCALTAMEAKQVLETWGYNVTVLANGQSYTVQW